LDAIRFDALARSLEDGFPRRAALGGMLAVGFSSLRSRFGAREAEAKKRRKKKKKCKGGKVKCGKKKCCAAGDGCLGGKCCPVDRVCDATCCAGGNACIAGVCCPTDRACGTICCAAGQICADPEIEVCVAGQGTCPSGANVCDGNATLCNNNNQCGCFESTLNTTRCGKAVPAPVCGQCSTDADCTLIFPDIAGVFCMKVGSAPCPCSPGQNQCAAPCPTA
jgi:hypothetical protein